MRLTGTVQCYFMEAVVLFYVKYFTNIFLCIINYIIIYRYIYIYILGVLLLYTMVNITYFYDELLIYTSLYVYVSSLYIYIYIYIYICIYIYILNLMCIYLLL